MMESGERQGYPGDRLYPLSEEYPTQFVPSAGAVNGLIIAVLDQAGGRGRRLEAAQGAAGTEGRP
jgi:hypothetical protein